MGELIDPADPEYEWKVAEQYQAAVDARRSAGAH